MSAPAPSGNHVANAIPHAKANADSGGKDQKNQHIVVPHCPAAGSYLNNCGEELTAEGSISGATTPGNLSHGLRELNAASERHARSAGLDTIAHSGISKVERTPALLRLLRNTVAPIATVDADSGEPCGIRQITQMLHLFSAAFAYAEQALMRWISSNCHKRHRTNVRAQEHATKRSYLMSPNHVHLTRMTTALLRLHPRRTGAGFYFGFSSASFEP